MKSSPDKLETKIGGAGVTELSRISYDLSHKRTKTENPGAPEDENFNLNADEESQNIQNFKNAGASP